MILLRSISGSDSGMILGIAAHNNGPLGRIRMAMDHLEKRLGKAAPNGDRS